MENVDTSRASSALRLELAAVERRLEAVGLPGYGALLRIAAHAQAVLSHQALRGPADTRAEFKQRSEAAWTAISGAAALGVTVEEYRPVPDQDVGSEAVVELPARTLYWRLNDTDYGPRWIEFEIDRALLERLDHVASLLVAGDVQSMAMDFPAARWRGVQDPDFDPDSQARVESEELCVSKLSGFDEGDPDRFHLSVSALLRHSEDRVEAGFLDLAELKTWLAAAPAGEPIFVEDGDLADGEESDFLTEVAQANESDAADTATSEGPRP